MTEKKRIDTDPTPEELLADALTTGLGLHVEASARFTPTERRELAVFLAHFIEVAEAGPDE